MPQPSLLTAFWHVYESVTMAPIKHTYNTPLDADYSVICIDDFQFNNNVGKSLDFETRYIKDKDQTECVWVFF